jgi:hypothetical protein
MKGVIVLLMAFTVTAGFAACDDAKMQAAKVLAVATGQECQHDCHVLMRAYFDECDRVYVSDSALHTVCKSGTIEAHQKCVEDCKSEAH